MTSSYPIITMTAPNFWYRFFFLISLSADETEADREFGCKFKASLINIFNLMCSRNIFNEEFGWIPCQIRLCIRGFAFWNRREWRALRCVYVI
jgi:hypothetical protein